MEMGFAGQATTDPNRDGKGLSLVLGIDERSTNYLPAPVTRATFPSREAEAKPRGPGIWSYFVTVPGIVIGCQMYAVMSEKS